MIIDLPLVFRHGKGQDSLDIWCPVIFVCDDFMDRFDRCHSYTSEEDDLDLFTDFATRPSKFDQRVQCGLPGRRHVDR